MAAVKCIKSCRCGPAASANAHINHRNGGGRFFGFDHGMSVGANWSGLNISVTVDILGFSHTAVSGELSE